MIDYKVFSRKFVSSPIAKLLSHKPLPGEQLMLPRDSVIHHIPESPTSLGIENNDFLIKNYHSKKILVYHIHELQDMLGTVKKTNVNFNNLVRDYHKTHINMSKMPDINKNSNLSNMPIVVNYGMLDKLYKYTNNMMISYQEWYNLRYTMWSAINHIQGDKHHFIMFKLPLTIPNKSLLFRYSENFNHQGLEIFYSPEHLNFLELWRMLDPDVKDSFDTLLTMESLTKVHFVFLVQGHFFIFRLVELLTWIQEEDNAINKFYVFIQKMFTYNSKLTLDDEDNILENVEKPESLNLEINDFAEKEENVNPKLLEIINEHGILGNLSQGEQKSLIKLSQKIHTMVDPIDKTTPVSQIKVTRKDLIIEPHEKIINDNIMFVDKSMLESKIRSFDEKYIKDVYHKDIMEAITTLPNVGLLIKKIETKDIQTAITKAREYSIQVQPVIGESSTIKIKVPLVDGDGSFKTGNVRYTMRKQKSDYNLI